MQMYHLAVQYRMTEKCASIRNVNFPLPSPNFPNDKPIQTEQQRARQSGTSDMLEAAVKESVAAIEEDGADTLILGCSAAFWMQPLLQKRLNDLGWEVPVLEGARSAIVVAKTLVDLGYDASGLAFPGERPARWRRKKTF
jgi:allantoin racemase